MIFERKQVVIVFSVVAIGASFLLLSYYPLSKTLKKSKEQKMQYDSFREQIYHDALGMSDLAKKITNLKAKIGRYNSKIPPNRDFAKFWDELTKVMNRCELTDRLIQPLGEVNGDTINSIPLNIKCSGKFNQLYEFLLETEKMDRIVRFEEIRIDNKDGSGHLTLYAKAVIYYQNKAVSLANGQR